MHACKKFAFQLAITLTYTFIVAVTGNANFNMHRTTFTMFGFTQPFTALPVIEDVSNNAKGFTSRILWFFPEPVFCKMKQNILDEEECQIVDTFKSQLGKSLTTMT